MSNSQLVRNRDVDLVFSSICKIADNVGKTAALISDPNIRNRLTDILDKLVEIDKNMAADLAAMEEIQTTELEEGVTLSEKYHQIRDAMEIDDLGQCNAKLDEIRERLMSSQATDGPDMEVLAVTYSEKDPISKENIKDPVKNIVCGHVYDRESVASFIAQCKQLRQLCQCPVRSCPNKQPLQMARMVPFPEFFNFIQKQT